MRSEVREFPVTGIERVELGRFDNAWYHPGSAFRRALWYLFSAVFVDSVVPWPVSVKVLLLRAFGARIGAGVVIKPRVRIKFPWFLKLGDHVWLGEDAWIDNLVDVTIGDNVCVSQGAYILTGNHNYSSPTFDLILAPVTIEEGAWIGAKSTVCPGATLRTHSVLSAGSVLSGNSQPWTIYRGNPAVPVRGRIIKSSEIAFPGN